MREHAVRLLTDIAFYIDVFGCLIMVWGFALCFVQFMKMEWGDFKGKEFIHGVLHIRFQLGSYLLLGLEFMIAGDVIHTVLDPSFEDILLVSVIVVIRTALAFFLGREMQALEQETETLESAKKVKG